MFYPTNNIFQIFQSVSTPKIKLPTLPKLELDFTPTTYYQEGVEESNDTLPKMVQGEQKVETFQPQTSNSTVETNNSTIRPTTSNSNISFKELIEKENLPIKINSGYRGKGSLRGGKTAQGRRSNHNRLDEHGNPMAYDISPKAGYTFEDLRQILYKNPTVVNWFNQRGWGILEEMQDGKRGFYDTEGKFHYTGATGPHFHIGPDSYGVRNYQAKIAKGQQGLKFPFMTFTPAETPKVELNFPLLDEPVDISDWASNVTPDGKITVKPNLPKMITDSTTQQIQPKAEPTKTSVKIPQSKGADALSKVIDEVATESGYEELKDPEVKQLLMLQAKRESNFTSAIKNPKGSALGYFQMTDKTRQWLSNYSAQQFANDSKEQVRAAYKLYKYIWDRPDAQKLLANGYNKAQITALGWWYPMSMQMILNGKKDFSLGGYSIKRALNDYK